MHRSRLGVVVATMALLLVLAPQHVRAYVYSPPWADAMWNHYPGTNGLDTTSAANYVKAGFDGPYHAFSSSPASANNAMSSSYAQSDAIWWMFGHAGPGQMEVYHSGTDSYLYISGYCASPTTCLTSYSWTQLHKIRLMVFQGCNTGQNMTNGDNLPLHVYSVQGVDSAIGFSAVIDFAPVQDQWGSKVASTSMSMGYTVTNAAWAATNWLGGQLGGDYHGYDSLVIYGGSTHLSPAAYGS